MYMSLNVFYLLYLKFDKTETILKKLISVQARLTVRLRFLATDELFTSLHYRLSECQNSYTR